MNEEPRPGLDWIHLPSECEVLSLWDCLHDARLLTCRSDLLGRTVSLDFDIPHLREASDDVTFLLHFDRVRSVRANVFVRWPGEINIPRAVSREQESLLIEEYQAKWREQSQGWNEFESALATDPLSVMDATLAQGDEKAALRLGGFLDGEKFDDQYCTVFIQCGAVIAARSDGQPFSLDDLMEAGHRYWEAFSARRLKRDAEG